MALSAVPQVLCPLLQRVCDRGVAAGLELVDGRTQAGLIQGAHRMRQARVRAGPRGSVAVGISTVDPQADLCVRGYGVEGTDQRFLCRVHLGATRGVGVLHGAGGVQHQQDLGGRVICLCGRLGKSVHGNQQQHPAGCCQMAGSGHRLTSNLRKCEFMLRVCKCQPPTRPRGHDPVSRGGSSVGRLFRGGWCAKATRVKRYRAYRDVRGE